MRRNDRLGLALSASICIAACSLALLAGCASPQSEFRPIEHPDRPIERLGFVLYPPSDGPWSLNETKEGGVVQLIFEKNSETPKSSEKITPTTFIRVLIARTPPEKFSKLFANQHVALEQLSKDGAQPSAGRFKDLVDEVTWGQLKGQEVSRVLRRVEERDNPVDRSAVLIVESRSTWIFHPTQATTSMWVMVSHRCPQGQEMPALAGMEEDFLSKIAFQ
jgi:hypothetical protein